MSLISVVDCESPRKQWTKSQPWDLQSLNKNFFTITRIFLEWDWSPLAGQLIMF